MTRSKLVRTGRPVLCNSISLTAPLLSQHYRRPSCAQEASQFTLSQPLYRLHRRFESQFGWIVEAPAFTHHRLRRRRRLLLLIGSPFAVAVLCESLRRCVPIRKPFCCAELGGVGIGVWGTCTSQL